MIVGGGPAGASTAVRLARGGLEVCVIDRSRFPRPKPCGEFLSPGATPILEELGVRGAVEAAGARRLERVRIVAHGAEVELDFPDDAGAPPWGYSLSRSRLDAILIEAARAAGARVIEDAVVDEVRIERGRAVVRARAAGDGARVGAVGIEARLVVGAGGRNCPVARTLGVQRRDRRGRFDLLAHWSGARPGPTATSFCELRVQQNHYVAVAPVEAGRWNVNCVVPRAVLRAEPDVRALYRRIVGRGTPVVAGAPCEDVVASDVTPLDVARASGDRAILVGDAALFLDPFTGQGIYLALRSAALAAETIVTAIERGRADGVALAGYDRAREREFAARRRVSRTLQRVLFRPGPARALVHALGRDPRLARILAAATGDLVPSERVLSPAFAAALLAASLRATAPRSIR